MVPLSSQNTVGVCNKITLFILYYISSRLVTLFKFLNIWILLFVSSFSILAFRYSFFLSLKRLLALHLTLFRLSTVCWFGSCTHCILACLFSSKIPKQSSSNDSLCCFNSCRPKTLFSCGFDILFMISQALFMSSSSLTFSKAANLLVISIWYCFLTSSSFSFLILNLSPSDFCVAHWLTTNLSLTYATTRYWSISQSAPLKDHTLSILECHLLSTNMWSIRLWVFLSGEV